MRVKSENKKWRERYPVGLVIYLPSNLITGICLHLETHSSASLHADIFVPQPGIVPDKIGHHAPAAFVVGMNELHSPFRQQFFFAHKILVLGDDHFWDTV